MEVEDPIFLKPKSIQEYAAPMRLMTYLTVLLSASSAAAQVPPGPPPWSCAPIEACNAENRCTLLLGLPLGFDLRESGNAANTFVVEGHSARAQIAMLFPTVEEAARFLNVNTAENGPSIILIRDDHIADSNGFRAYIVYVRGSGGKFMSKDNILISCGSILK